jgi:hypothetical protein
MKGLAKRLWQTKMYYEWARRPLIEVWKECDDAYLCYRELPYNEGMVWTDKSDFGETDIFDGVNTLAARLSLALLPKDGSWLTVVSRQNDDPQVVDDIQQQQIWMHNKAHTRRVIAKHLKQLMIRGTSAIFWTWEHRARLRKVSDIEGRRHLKRILQKGGLKRKHANMIDDMRMEEPEYIGPKIRVLDCLDLYMDPANDLSVDRNTGTIIATYRRLSELKKETDRDGKNLYDNLDGIEAFTATEIYMKDIEGSNRIRDLNTLGVFPQNQPYRNEGYVPVYICHMPFYEHEDEEFYDTYFYLAESREGSDIRLIRVEQNPSADGHQFVIKDTMCDWFGNTAYGISLVEKMLSSYKQKNVIKAVTLEAAITSVFPAYNVLAGVLRDETGVSFSPGSLNEFAQNPMNEKFISPMPVPQQGVAVGMQELKFWGEMIAANFGEWGAGVVDNPTKSVSSRETATAANIKATSGSLAIDELVEKFTVSVQELAQGVYDLARQELEPDENGQIAFPRQTGVNKVQQVGVDWDQFVVARDILVSGQHGQFNKAQEIQNMNEALEGLGKLASILPNASALAQPIVLRLLDKLGITVPDEAKMSPVQLAAQNPQVMQQAAQNPQVQQLAVASVLQQHPEIAGVLQSHLGAQGQQGTGAPPKQGPQQRPPMQRVS